MQSIKVTILGKQIPLKVEEGEVESMKKIAGFVDEKFRIYRQELTNQPDSTAMILASLSIAGELFELRQEVAATEESEELLMREINGKMEKLITEIS
ncbi:cell division protein ZapA [Rhodohalobacter sp. SW132]|uniref:cell division protein ZapA n=1 Tax=Rhodohalobacter sp. SW132 TaxID=2293433 RepID=UPI000E22BE45|nr:cell division protein ZapA [Rhodohalobacter sp. SW132]REL37970.1 cell division protein ZapA [Rhodohalobacter sp. SW132]